MIALLLVVMAWVAAGAQYSPKSAIDMLYMSEIAYFSASSIEEWSCVECKKYRIEHPKVFENSTTSTQGFTGYLPHSKQILIAFRGSSDFRDWITNLNTTTTDYPFCTECQVHQGFYNAYDSVAATVKSQVQQLLASNTDANIVVTGHSLGGALANLCALDIGRIYKVDSLTTFGQPRVGNKQFAAHLTHSIPNSFRVIDYADVVAHAPPSYFGFEHGGSEIWYSPRGMQTFSTCYSEDPSCANSINALSFSTQDHKIANYKQMKVSTSFADNLQLLKSFIKRVFSLSKKTTHSREQLKHLELLEFNRIVELYRSQQLQSVDSIY